MDKVYKYKGKEYNSRRKSFKSYRIKAIVLQKKYTEFEAENFPTIAKIQADIEKYFLTDKKITNKLIANQKDSSKLNKAVADAIVESPDVAMKMTQLAKEKEEARELFLFSDGNGGQNDENVEKLFEIMLEDTTGINHDVDALDFEEYLIFVYEIWDDFFLKLKKRMSM